MGSSRVRAAGLVIFVGVVAAFVAAAPASALVYWANSGENHLGTSIGRANLDGSGVDDAFLASPEKPCGVAVDDEHIYWAHRATFPVGGIARADLDGTNVDLQFIDTGFSPCGVAVNDTHVYWADFGNGIGDTIGRANLDGTGVDPELISTAQGVCGIDVDADHVYWGVRASAGNVGRANLDGSNVDNDFVAAAEHSCGVAVDDSHLYWADLSGSFGSGSVGRADLDGTDADIDFIPNASGVGSPCGLALDGEHLYWGDTGEQVGPGRVGRANLDGSSIDPAFIVTEEASCGVAVDATAEQPPVSNRFSFGKLKRNKRLGTAKLAVKVPGSGELIVAGKGIKRGTKAPGAARTVKLEVRAKSAAARKLRKRGKVVVQARVTYRPQGGEARTKTKRVKLVKRRR